MARRSALIASILLLPLIAMNSSLHAQASTVDAVVHAGGRMPAIWISGGAVMGRGGINNDELATAAGGVMMAALELPGQRTLGPMSFAVRAELRWSQQSLETSTNSGVSGNVQTLGGGLTLRASPRSAGMSAARRVTPYLLAGIGVTRPSTRVLLSMIEPDVPSARFAQTSSEVAPAVLGGLGISLDIGFSQLFAEARAEYAQRDAGLARALFGTIGLAFPSRP